MLRRLIFLLLLWVGCTALWAAPTPPPQLEDDIYRPQDWHFTIAPYVWLSGNNGYFDIFNTRANFSVPPTNFHDADFGGALIFEASKERWSLILNPSYVKFTQIQYINDQRVKPSVGIVTIDTGAYYRVLPEIIAGESKLIASLELLGGFRIMGFHSVINYFSATTPDISDATNIIAPILGARIKYNPCPNFQAWINADFGGFKIDRVSSTWGVMTGVNYFFSKNWGASLAYKAVGINYYERAYTINTVTQGPMIGLVYSI